MERLSRSFKAIARKKKNKTKKQAVFFLILWQDIFGDHFFGRCMEGFCSRPF